MHVESREDFVKFVNSLLNELEGKASRSLWKNIELDCFLDAMAEYLRMIEKKNQAPVIPSWGLFAEVLANARTFPSPK